MALMWFHNMVLNIPNKTMLETLKVPFISPIAMNDEFYLRRKWHPLEIAMVDFHIFVFVRSSFMSFMAARACMCVCVWVWVFSDVRITNEIWTSAEGHKKAPGPRYAVR